VAVGLALAIAGPFLQTTNPTLGAASLIKYTNWLAPSSLLLLPNFLWQRAGLHSVLEGWTVLVHTLMVAALLAGLVLIGRQVIKRAGMLTAAAEVAIWSWVLLLSLLTAPIIWPWYVVWLLPLIWLAPSNVRVPAVAMWLLMPPVMTVAERRHSPAFFGINVAYSAVFVLPILGAMLVWFWLDLRRRVRFGVPLEAETSSDTDALLAGIGPRLVRAVLRPPSSSGQTRTKTAPSLSP